MRQKARIEDRVDGDADGRRSRARLRAIGGTEVSRTAGHHAPSTLVGPPLAIPTSPTVPRLQASALMSGSVW